ncbi:MAG: uroporphyrinogen-III C-methyltransferase [Burkholderiales bacterium]
MADSTPPGEDKPTPRRAARLALSIAVAFGLVALALLWLWYDGRGQMSALREEVARRVRDSETDSRDARLAARQGLEASREAQAKLAQLDLKMADLQSQQAALEALYQDLSGARDEWTLLEIEQILTIASQQLQLSGNVPAALSALQMADARLARSGRPQFLPLRKVFARDMERLKAESGPDLSELAAKLDRAIASVESISLVQDQRPEAQPARAPEPGSGGGWDRIVSELRALFNRFVRVQRVEGSEPALLSPTQSFFLRENLKLRLLSARLALLGRDVSAYRNDLKVSSSWLERYFHTGSGAGALASALLKELGSGASGVSLPTIEESLSAVRGFKAVRQRAGR